MPNGATDLAVLGAQSTSVSITDNVYDVEVTGTPSGVSFTDVARINHTVPLSAPTDTCESPSTSPPAGG